MNLRCIVLVNGNLSHQTVQVDGVTVAGFEVVVGVVAGDVGDGFEHVVVVIEKVKKWALLVFLLAELGEAGVGPRVGWEGVGGLGYFAAHRGYFSGFVGESIRDLLRVRVVLMGDARY